MEHRQMRGEIVYRELTRDDIPSMTELFNSLFIVQKPVSWFIWQTFEYLSPVLALGAFYEGRLIGTFGIQERTLGNGLVCGQAQWPAVAPEWQNKSIFAELVKMVLARCQDHLDLLFNFFPEKARTAIEKSLDMRMHRINTMLLASPEIIDNPGVVVARASENTVFKQFHRHVNDTIMFSDNQAYRAWRYARNPLYAYDMVQVPSGEYAVVKQFIDPVTKGTYGDIIDIECAHDDREKLRHLIRGACWYLKTQGMKPVIQRCGKLSRKPVLPRNKRVIATLGSKSLTASKTTCMTLTDGDSSKATITSTEN
jgi:hypothetical protein